MITTVEVYFFGIIFGANSRHLQFNFTISDIITIQVSTRATSSITNRVIQLATMINRIDATDFTEN